MFVELPRILNEEEVFNAESEGKALPDFDTEPVLLPLDTISEVSPAPQSYPYTYIIKKGDEQDIPIALVYHEARDRIEEVARS